MKNKIMIFAALMLTLGVTSCHKDSDVVLNYGVNDDSAFGEASKSFAGKFKVFWKSMNTTYSLWDYEKECGLDWDAYYNEMLPEFEELDEMDNVSDEDLKKVMRKMAAPLHDGHISIEFENHKTGSFIKVSPNAIRNETRPDLEHALRFVPDLSAYDENHELTTWLEANTSVESQLKYMTQTKDIGYQWALAKYYELMTKQNPTEKDAFMLGGLTTFCVEMQNLLKRGYDESTVAKFNQLVVKYMYLNIPFLEPISTAFEENAIQVKYALFNDNIAYFYLSGFKLAPYMNDADFRNTFGESSHTQEVASAVRRVYNEWFETIQELHKEKNLRGVIIDLRSNPGGFVSDSRYVLGSLIANDDVQYGFARFKRGPGRYDYSPYIPMFVPTMPAEHEVIDDVPITILVNCMSVSMSETTALLSKQIPNARLIGRRTWGGLCMLSSPEDFSTNYSGYIGESGKTPVYVYLPMVGIFDMNKKSLEGYGVEPDIEVDFDHTEYVNTGHDTQLDRALKYIRTGN